MLNGWTLFHGAASAPPRCFCLRLGTRSTKSLERSTKKYISPRGIARGGGGGGGGEGEGQRGGLPKNSPKISRRALNPNHFE